jgi:hypothetical protein
MEESDEFSSILLGLEEGYEAYLKQTSNPVTFEKYVEIYFLRENTDKLEELRGMLEEKSDELKTLLAENFDGLRESLERIGNITNQK